MTQPENPFVLDVKGLSGGYGPVPILHNISFGVHENEITGALGHNGMGKSTLLKTLIGLLPATSGEIMFRGAALNSLPPHKRARLGMGYVPQGREIFPQLSVSENLRFAYHDYGEGNEEQTLEYVLGHFHQLERLLGRQGGALSGGEQQLLVIARCLMGRPEFLLLDEPTEGIQPSIIDEIVETLLSLRRNTGLSILLVEQNVDFILDLSNRVLTIERGTITGELSHQDIANRNRASQFLGFSARESATPKSDTGLTTPKPLQYVAQEPLTDSASSALPGTNNPKPCANSQKRHSDTTMSENMTVKRPTQEKMRDMAQRFGMSISDEQLSGFSRILEPYIQSYDRVSAHPDNLPEVRYPRSPGYRPEPEENTLNAWYYKTNVQGAMSGPLRGKSIALKDTVCLAGVPMMNGSSIMDGYTPEIDATVVTRILEAGGTIAGKAHCEYLCLSGGSHTSAAGAVHNPWKRGYMAGGSSSGSGALVGSGEVNMAIGGDQGGSIRIPSSNCGCYGMKPTHGLVPYTGVMPIEQTIDHVGPITGTVYDNALLLEAIAGPDGLDPRQYNPETSRYTEALGQSVANLRIGVLKEGFDRPESEADVDAKVREAVERLGKLGAHIKEISIPEHLLAVDLWTIIAVEGLQDHMMHGNCGGTNYRGLYLPSMMDKFSTWKYRADELSHSLKVCMFLGEFYQTQYGGRFYGKAQNLIRKVTEKYRSAFREVDFLLMPTVPMKAQPIPEADASMELHVQRAFEMIGNTAPFNATGLPAMSIPCGLSEGLPIGMMLAGNRYREAQIYQMAYAFEQSGDWRNF